ncbi:MAG: hypothetical protein LBV52_04100 [Spirochaetaceae bacterium]|jgi:tetratricopeptide (TPR) repeat protein|nr:hypothetical protein [Spirochaetaceae bacterium]
MRFTFSNIYKIIFCCSLFFASTVSVFSQGASKSSPFGAEKKPYWWTLEQGKKAFREGAYGNALIAFETARNDRREMYTKMEADWISLLSIDEVRRMHNSLEQIERYIQERGQFDAAAGLAEIYYRIKKEVLNDSAQTVLNYFGRLKEYPEADYWIGETYRLEGELSIALKQYKEALKNSEMLQDPDFIIEIQYKIAEVEKLRQNYNAMQTQLEEIIQRDKVLQGNTSAENSSFLQKAMRDTLARDGINNFLVMYRYKNTQTEKAYRLLGYFYYSSGRHEKAQEQLVFAALIQNTIIIEQAIEKRFDFKFSTLENLMTEIERRTYLHEYMRDTEYFKTLYYLAVSLYATNKQKAANSIWQFLAKENKAGQWQSRSKKQLASPYIERAVEMP